MLTIDTVIHQRYRIIRQLGQGGMGAVYEAIDERLDKTVAIKEILLELENASDERQKDLLKRAFQREAGSLVKAKHEAVPDVTDYFSEFDRQFLVMEYIRGDDLARMLKNRQKPFPLEEVLPWIKQLLEALDYLHNLTPPIIHRDIKPQNLKINAFNKIKLLDFGIAKSTDKTATVTQNTFIGATLAYSPIEQILRVIDPMFRELILLKHKENAERILAQNTDARCDIFAIGATFYHLLTDHPPVDITKRTLETWDGKPDPLPSPSEINPAIPSAVSAWLVKAMAVERDDRFATAAAMQQTLDTAIAAQIRPQSDIKTQIIDRETLTTDQERELTEAKTESFFTKETGGEIVLDTRNTRPSTPEAEFTAETQAFDNSTTDPQSTEIFETPPTEDLRKSEEETASYFDENLFVEKKPARLVTTEQKTDSNKSSQLLWIVPGIVLIFLALFCGIGGTVLWWSGFPESKSNTNGVDVSPTPGHSTQTPGSKIENSGQTNANEDSTPTPTVAETKSPDARGTALPTPRSTVKSPPPTPVQPPRTPRPTPVRTPKPTGPTPKPTAVMVGEITPTPKPKTPKP